MMALKNHLYNMSGKCPNVFLYLLSRSTRRSHSLITANKRVAFSGDLWREASRVLRLASCYHPVRERISKYCQNSAIDIQPVHFEDTSFEQPVSHDDLLSVLQKCQSVEEQIQSLASTLALTSEEIERRVNFCKTFECLLRPFFGDFRIQMFGSTVNGYGFKGCDIDMSFEVPGPRNEKVSTFLERPDYPLVHEVISGEVSPQELVQLPAKEQLLFIHSALQEYYKESSKPPIFIDAHVPVVRFYHDKYNLKVDLSCRNNVAFSNTKLLYLFGELDSRVTPFIMFIRYWAKHVGIIGKGLMFNTYTITLLAIYFLQTRNPPILPSAEIVISLSSNIEIEDMNDRSFLDVKKYIPPSENTQTLGELLKEFFYFYTYFDFDKVVCPLTATAVPRSEFLSSPESKKFRINTICVQDPMLVSHNVADLVDYKYCKILVGEMMVAYKIFQDNAVFSPSNNSKWGLMSVLDKPGEYAFNQVRKQKQISFAVPLVSSNPKGQDKIPGDKVLLSAKTVLNILQYALHIECRKLNSTEILNILKKNHRLTEQKRLEAENVILRHWRHSKPKSNAVQSQESNVLQEFREDSALEHFKKFNADHELTLCAECFAPKDTWDKGNLYQLDSDNSSKLLETEHLVLDHVTNHNEENVMQTNSENFRFLLECYASPKTKDSSLIVIFRPLQKIYFNPRLGMFLKEYILNIIDRINNSL